MAEFVSVVDAVRCAVEVQRGMAKRNEGTPPENSMQVDRFDRDPDAVADAAFDEIIDPPFWRNR